MTMRVVSGIQPTGQLHLGNYLGAIRNWVRMQDQVTAGGQGDRQGKRQGERRGETLFFLADLHAITVHVPPHDLRDNVRTMATALIASGIDPDRSVLFNQARVPQHAELAWLLFCTARIGWLNRMTQFKEKSGKHREGASVGLYAYPVLQAADVLLYQATHVPVGEDQKQHLELARDIAQKFNVDYCSSDEPLFTLPDPIIPPAAARIMSLRDGTAKMSKSDPSDMSRIGLTDDPDLIVQKVRKAKTDADTLPSEPAGLEGRPEAANLVAIHAALGDESIETVLRGHAGHGFGPFKSALVERVIETLRPIREAMAELSADPGTVDAILVDGAARARALAAPTLAATYDALGLSPMGQPPMGRLPMGKR